VRYRQRASGLGLPEVRGRGRQSTQGAPPPQRGQTILKNSRAHLANEGHGVSVALFEGHKALDKKVHAAPEAFLLLPIKTGEESMAVAEEKIRKAIAS